MISPYAVNVASWDWVKYSDFVHVNRTVTDPMPVVVTLTVRDGPMLSVNDTVAEIPDTRAAEHDTDDGDTVNASLIAPAPVRDASS